MAHKRLSFSFVLLACILCAFPRRVAPAGDGVASCCGVGTSVHVVPSARPGCTRAAGVGLCCLLRVRGGSAEQTTPDLGLVLDASYWHEVGPRLMTTIKDMVRATEKLLDHSAASMRALHSEMEKHGEQLRVLQEKAAMLSQNPANTKEAEEEACGQMLDMTLDMQQSLMLHLGTVLMLARRAKHLEHSVMQSERLIQGGVLQELQQHLEFLTERRRVQHGAAEQQAQFEHNFDRMAMDWMLWTGQPQQVKRFARLADLPLPLAFSRFEVHSAAVGRMLQGDLGPIMLWYHTNRKALAKNTSMHAETVLAHLQLQQIAEVRASRNSSSLTTAVQLWQWWCKVLVAQGGFERAGPQSVQQHAESDVGTRSSQDGMPMTPVWVYYDLLSALDRAQERREGRGPFARPNNARPHREIKPHFDKLGHCKRALQHTLCSECAELAICHHARRARECLECNSLPAAMCQHRRQVGTCAECTFAGGARGTSYTSHTLHACAPSASDSPIRHSPHVLGDHLHHQRAPWLRETPQEQQCGAEADGSKPSEAGDDDEKQFWHRAALHSARAWRASTMLLVFDSASSLDIARRLHSTQRRQALARACYTQMYGLHGGLGEHAGGVPLLPLIMMAALASLKTPNQYSNQGNVRFSSLCVHLCCCALQTDLREPQS